VPVRGAGRGCWLVEPSTRPSRPVFVPGVGAARAGAPGGAVGAGSGHTVGVLKNQAPPLVWLVRWAVGPLGRWVGWVGLLLVVWYFHSGREHLCSFCCVLVCEWISGKL
jgi:hypothetical protein